MTDTLRRAFGFLAKRRMAYVKTFENHRTAGTPAHDVLKDLARFCRAHDTAYNPDPRTHALLEGRREVFLRIQRHLRLSDEELWALLDGRDIKKAPGEGG